MGCILGAVSGALVGAVAPAFTTYLYTLDGPDPTASFDPLLFGSGHGALWGLLLGAAIGVLVSFGVGRSGRVPRLRLRTMVITVVLVALTLAVLIESTRR